MRRVFTMHDSDSPTGARHSFTSRAGRDEANPTAMLQCSANMLRHMNLERHAVVIETALQKTIKAGKVSVIDKMSSTLLIRVS